MPDALAAARALGNADAWRQVAAAALAQLDVPLAVAAYRQVNVHGHMGFKHHVGQQPTHNLPLP